MAGNIGQFEEQVYGLSTNILLQRPAIRNAITAKAAGGQQLPADASTVQLNTVNRVTVVATAGDSVTLAVAVAGQTIVVLNNTATSMNVFPGLGDVINQGAANAALAVAGGKSATFYCTIAGFWNAIVSA